MEIHLVHQDTTGHLLVVAVFVSLGEYNPVLATMQNWVQPDEKPHTIQHREKVLRGLHLHVGDLLPKHLHHFSYHGSLTTPPCTQGVQWIVMRTPKYLSQVQLHWFTSISGFNARSIQPLHDREVDNY